MSWYFPTNTTWPDRIGFSKQFLVSCQTSLTQQFTCTLVVKIRFSFRLVMLLRSDCLGVLEHTGEAAYRLWTEEEGSGGGWP